jgi:hypothetical protein
MIAMLSGADDAKSRNEKTGKSPVDHAAKRADRTHSSGRAAL